RVPVQGVMALDREKDFSILKLEGGLYSTLELGDSDTLKVYDYTSALGYPSQSVQEEREGMKGALLQTYGFILGIHPQAFPDFSFLYNTTPFQPGFSGGPLLDKDNKVVGLATLEGRSINLALPINTIKPHVNDQKLMTFKQLLTADQLSKEALYYRGNFALYALGESNQAIDLYQRALKIDPDFVLARYDLAVTYRGLGEVDKAIAEYEKVLKINPRFPEALSNLGGQYFRKGNVKQAVAYFQRAIEVYPNFIQALSNLGAALNKQGKSKEALPHLKKALSLDPEFAVAYFNLGNAHFGAGNLDEAEKAFKTAIEKGIDFLSLHWKLHEIYLKKGQRKQAINELQIILQMDPQHPDAQKKLKELQAPTP
ncbi:MAG TPA: tetratricopeptide repeat protein, partial [Desulfobacteria bacterium]|nr:tetratricopeptide repeat protein [Desulfobacteria bacterium]